MLSIRSAAGALAVLSVASGGFASLSQSDIAAPGGFVQSGVSPVGQGFSLNVGSDFEVLYNDAVDVFSEGSFNGIGTVTRSTSQANRDSTGTVSMGQIKLTANSTSPNSGFANGGAHGGFKENFTIATGSPGTTGWMLVDVMVSGSASASGFAGRSLFNIGAFKDDVELLSNSPHWDNGNSDPISTDRQRARWAVSTSAPGTSDSRVVSDMVTFAVPITFGDGFSFGIYGFASAGKRSSSGVAGTSSASIDFGNTITWGGINAILDASGNEITSYTLSSDTGLDWTGVVPSPGTVVVFSAVGGLGLRRRR